MSETIDVTIMSPEEVVWEGKARALTSSNREGTFDILPAHANFMTLIKNTDLIVHLLDGKKTRVFSFDRAVLFFQKDSAKIYIHTDEALEESKNDKV